MPNINLIHQKRVEKARLEKSVRRLFFLMSGTFIAAILLFTALSAQWFRLKSQTRDLEDELTELEPKIKIIKEYEAKTAALAPKIELYSSAGEHTMRWYTFLQVVARTLPEHTWLTNIATKQETPKPNETPPEAIVTVSGTTMTQNLVGETMLALNKYPQLINSVNLGFTRENTTGPAPVVEFEIKAQIKDLPAYFVDAASRKKTEQAQNTENADNKGGSNEESKS